MLASQSAPPPLIVESYRHYAPPFNAKRDVEMLLRHIPRENLIGLHSVVLTNVSGLSREERRQKTWSRNRKVRLSECRGWYTPSTRTSGARITLLVDNIFAKARKSNIRFAPIRTLALAQVLYHEVGHHIHTARRPEYRGKEDVAESWKAKLETKFLRERYWYLFPVALPVKLVMDLKGDFGRLIRYVKRRRGWQ